VSLLVGVVGILVFGVGMCMCLLPEWNVFGTGVAVTAAGALALIALGLVRWSMVGRPVGNPNWKRIAKIAYCVAGALVLGLGMSCCMVWGGAWFVPGILIGLMGIADVAAAYPVYLYVVKNERERVAPEILRWSDEPTK